MLSEDGLQIENAQGFSNFQDVPGPILKCGPGKFESLLHKLADFMQTHEYVFF